MAHSPRRPGKTTALLLCLLLLLPGAALWAQAPPALEQGAQWTILVYLDGDNNLETEAIEDFLEIASVGSNDQVQIVVQFDRTPGYDDRYGDWRGALRFHVTPGLAPEPANALVNLGEVNMGDVQTLVDFYQWGMAAFPARRTTLVLWNHGDGWRANSVTQDTRKAVCWDETELDALDLSELGDG
ncbi:MAG: clostripain-related cysteine peptidase, partial [Anaerolineae bacterium]